MDDDDAMVVAGGGLKIKAGVVVKKSKKDKKKEKKKEKKEKKRSRVEDEPSKPGLVPVALPTMTAAEIKFLEKRRKQEEARLDKASSKSHREKVAEFNAALARLSEHHDIPKGEWEFFLIVLFELSTVGPG